MKVPINIYQFSELSDKAKEAAIQKHREFELAIMSPSDFISGQAEYDTEEELQKAYNSEYKHREENDAPIMESIEANDYWFFADGEMAQVVSYVGKHPKTGQTELTFHGEIITLDIPKTLGEVFQD